MQNEESFGERIRRLREESGVPIRKVAAFLDLDPSTLSKIERNERSASREQVTRLSSLFKLNERDLLVTYLSDKIIYALKDEDCRQEVLKVAERRIRYERSKEKRK